MPSSASPTPRAPAGDRGLGGNRRGPGLPDQTLQVLPRLINGEDAAVGLVEGLLQRLDVRLGLDARAGDGDIQLPDLLPVAGRDHELDASSRPGRCRSSPPRNACARASTVASASLTAAKSRLRVSA